MIEATEPNTIFYYINYSVLLGFCPLRNVVSEHMCSDIVSNTCVLIWPLEYSRFEIIDLNLYNK